MSIEPKQKIAVLGLGLIGGSVAAGLKRQGVFVSAFDANFASLAEGEATGVIDQGCDSIALAVADADIIVIAVPVLMFSSILPELRNCVDRDDVAITDVSSVKGAIADNLKSCFGHIPTNFIPGHPIAGSEKHGVSAANADLFDKHKVILTPNETSSRTHTDAVTTMWQSLGAQVSLMSIEHHDLVLAQTSHLPHLLAFALIDTLSAQGHSLEVFDYAAGGLRDFSRIAASDPTMWRDIFESNRLPLLEVLTRYQSELDQLKRLIETNQLSEVHDILTRSKKARDHFSTLLADREK